MQGKRGFITTFILMVILVLAVGGAQAAPLGSAFTYQGRLNDNGQVADGVYDFQFKLFDTESGGNQVGVTVVKENIPVTKGLFTIPDLDFGSGIFNGEARWLEIGVRPEADTSSFTVLSPLQAITATPYALYAANAPTGTGGGISTVNAGAGLTGGGSNLTVTLDVGQGAGILVDANSVSADTTYLQRRVSSTCAAGSSIRVINPDGTVTCQTDSNSGGTVTAVTASAPLASSGGTAPNITLTTPIADSNLATIATAGKVANSATTATSSNTPGTIVARDASGNFVANVITANLSGTATAAATAGTATNFSGSLSGDVTGTQAATSVVRLQGRSLASTAPASGQVLKWNGTQWAPGTDNNSNSFWSLTGNGGTTTGTNYLGTSDNVALEFRVNNTRALRIEPTTETPNIIGGHFGNWVTVGHEGATIGGGGGYFQNNRVTYSAGTVGGGLDNQAGNDDVTTLNSAFATVGGGFGNTASRHGSTVGGGVLNIAGNEYATVGGGYHSDAIGQFATVPGGRENTALGDYSLAAGRYAKANHQGAFVWADNTETNFASTADNQFLVRAGGGIRFVRGGSTFTSSLASFHVENFTSSGEGAWIRQVNAAANYPVLKVLQHGDATINFIEGQTLEGTSPGSKFRITKDGQYIQGSGDFAELLPAEDGLEPGDVLAIGPDGNLQKTSSPYQWSVAGVYSAKPGFVGGDTDDENMNMGKVPLAIMGVVPVKVTVEGGVIRPGDLLTSSSLPGHAMRAERTTGIGTVIGKALQGLSAGTGMIRMLVTLQ